MGLAEKISDLVGEKIRATAHILTHKDSGLEEWVAVVDSGENRPITKSVFKDKRGRVVAEELIRQPKPSYLKYQVFIKDGNIVSHRKVVNKWKTSQTNQKAQTKHKSSTKGS